MKHQIIKSSMNKVTTQLKLFICLSMVLSPTCAYSDGPPQQTEIKKAQQEAAKDSSPIITNSASQAPGETGNATTMADFTAEAKCYKPQPTDGTAPGVQQEDFKHLFEIERTYRKCIEVAKRTRDEKCNKDSPFWSSFFSLSSPTEDQGPGAASGVNGGAIASGQNASQAASKIEASKAECSVAFETAEAKCGEAQKLIESQKNQCLGKAEAMAKNCDTTSSQNFKKACEEKAAGFTKEIVFRKEEYSAKKIAMWAAGAAALGGLASVMMKSKKSKDQSSSSAQPEKPAAKGTDGSTATADPQCQGGDFTCLCQPTRAHRPLECAAQCPMSSRGPDVACLTRTFGSGYASSNKVLDQSGAAVEGNPGERAAEVTSPNGTDSSTTTISTSSAGVKTNLAAGTYNSNSYGKYNQDAFKDANTTAAGKVTSANLSAQISGGRGTDVASGAGSDGSSADANTLAAKQTAARMLASTTLSAADAELLKQLAPAASNLFSNANRVIVSYRSRLAPAGL